MRSFLSLLLMLFMLTSTALPISAQQLNNLNGHVAVLNAKGKRGKPVSDIKVFADSLYRFDISDKKGAFTIPLPASMGTGNTVNLSIENEAFQIYKPLRGNVYIRSNNGNRATIQLLPKGSKLFLSAHVIEYLLQEHLDRQFSASQSSELQDASYTLGLAIQQWALYYGFSENELKRAIEVWTEEAGSNEKENPYRAGLAAFVAGRIADAITLFNNPGSMSDGQIKNLQVATNTAEAAKGLQYVKSYQNAGRLSFQQGKLEAALRSFKRANELANEAYPDVVAGTFFEQGVAQFALAKQGTKSQKLQRLTQGSQSFRESLKFHNVKTTPEQWVQSQLFLGRSLLRHTELSPATEKKQLLEDAQAAFRLAQQTIKRETSPATWGLVQKYAGDVIFERIADTQTRNISRFEDLEQRYQLALEELSPARLPQLHLETKLKLGKIQYKLGRRYSGETAINKLTESASTFLDVLSIVGIISTPHEKGQIYFQLANVYLTLSERETGEDRLPHLRSAESNYRISMETLSRDIDLEEWSLARMNLGYMLSEICAFVDQETCIQLSKESVLLSDDALVGISKEREPYDWGQLQINRGNTFSTLGRLVQQKDAATYFRQSESAYSKALEVFNEKYPAKQAGARIGAAWARYDAFRGMSQPERLDAITRSLKQLDQASSYYTKARDPAQWAYIQHRNCILYNDEGVLGKEPIKSFDKAIEACRKALEVYTFDSHPSDWAYSSLNYGNALTLRGRLFRGQSIQYQRQAEKQFEEVLDTITRENYPKIWESAKIAQVRITWSLAWSSQGAKGKQLYNKAINLYQSMVSDDLLSSSRRNWILAELDILKAEKTWAYQNDFSVGEISRVLDHSISALESRDSNQNQLQRLSIKISQIVLYWAVRKQHLDKALHYTEKCIELNPENPNSLDTLAEVYFQMGQYDKAEATNKLAIKHAGEQKSILRLTSERAERLAWAKAN